METLEVEGDWKNFSFHIAQRQHCHAIASHIRQHDWREDPLDKHFCNMQMRSPFYFSDSNFYGYTEQNLSLVAFDKPNGKVAGVQLNSMKPKSAVLLMAVINKPFPVHQTRKEVAKAQLLQRINNEESIIRKYPEIEHFISFDKTVVAQEYRGQGLATQMWEMSIKMVKAKKCPLIACWSSNPAIHKIGKKTGFEELVKVKINEWKYFDGERELVAPTAGEDEVVMSMVKKIN
ncbi:hypothetical protein Ocin01_19597 [Orchesella cincta]|uniref:N-acetyltransferase domain-containing protein n=1 Tax=Orchesella cincta TaxID=48709 RepID=A0A1D2M287_ORCCI|nr:hypothetical protein Ocin01_19597 [Orchesella cincta]